MLSDSKAFSGFSVRDLDEARAFYTDTLGLSVSDPNEMGIFAIELATGTRVLVYPKGDAHEPASFTVLNFPVADIEAAVAGLAERGIEFERYEGTEIETDEKGIFRGGGPLIAWFKDPSGNVFAVMQDD